MTVAPLFRAIHPRHPPATVATIFLLLAACSTTVEPITRVYASVKSAGPPVVYVTANAKQQAVERALRDAGVALAPNLIAATLVLRVKVGDGRRFGRCGRVRNVLFDLREANERIVVMKARGWVGDCKSPNILRDMSRELARMLSGTH